MKIAPRVVLVLILLALPIVARRAFFYRGQYQPGPLQRPLLSDIKAPLPPTCIVFRVGLEGERDPAEPAEVSTQRRDTVLFDMAHENNFQPAELNALLAGLNARGHTAEFLTDSDETGRAFRYAKALVIISPHDEFDSEEVAAIRDFVDKGARLLLVTDPTRYDLADDEGGHFGDFVSDVGPANTLSANFGLVFEDDFLYNVSENEGNFQNVILRDFRASPLTRGLGKVVFYATHSITIQGWPLILGDANTASSRSDRMGSLVTAAMSNDGQVLAIGDLTFMTEPYNTVRDNSQLVANIADFLTTAERRYGLTDFPYFFAPEVDVVYLGAEAFDSEVLAKGGALQEELAWEGVGLSLKLEEDPKRDTMLIGLYEDAEIAQDYLAKAGVSIVITPTEQAAEVTPTPEVEVTPTVTPTVEAQEANEEEQREEGGRPLGDHLIVEEVGRFVLDGTALLYLHEEDGRQVLLVLADGEDGLAEAMTMLVDSEFSRCLSANSVTLCAAGEPLLEPESGGELPPDHPPI